MCLLADILGIISCAANYTRVGRRVSGTLFSISACGLSSIALGMLFMMKILVVV